MIKHQNNDHRTQRTWHDGKKHKWRTKVDCCKTGSDDRAAAEGTPRYDSSAGQRNQNLNCDLKERIANPEGELTHWST